MLQKSHVCIYVVSPDIPPRKEITKTALGAQDTVPWQYHPLASDVVKSLISQNVYVLAVEHTTESQPLWDVELRFPVCFVFGYEIEGISQSVLDLCHGAIEIPMYGFKGSLNVAVSCAIVLYEALRRLHI